MEFHSWKFGVFLTVVVGLFWVLANRRSARSWMLLVASYVFYGAWTPWFLSLIVFSTVLDYFCGKWLDESESPGRRKLLLLASLGGNLGLLCFFKYTFWLSSLIDPLLESAGVSLRLVDYSWAAITADGGWRSKVVPVAIATHL